LHFQSNLKKYYPEIVKALREQMLHSFHTTTPHLYSIFAKLATINFIIGWTLEAMGWAQLV
jgi:hypothetical protein